MFTPPNRAAFSLRSSARLGEFDIAEDAMHDAFVAAAGQWAHEGIPTNV
jgi:predicted RNA polymerase sigma factor